ncbi:choice-of-anchor M domain-containing protein [Tuwongella immobilis]|uniref:FG-GAP repeat protein n=1 Tax=Tuwongella immobilis TaxID=692036 RepID=A0A6C2YWD9_9BACT|nr:choice-of-anchor M domain-containing protein [Tuwongella immobilis]VIP05259.1 na-ca exchanger integrin-beta4 : Hemolysin-type calcium-binding region domain protein OS=Rhodopirellula maiorica SM1 GN=RMSM_03614 PE=4 SV=1: VCBS [Tuwongella immobilis]VTS07874.1 na-ca exchanger integrin-beta4 : Hemolysin-type calcium-binding region domain protein OS=Rhodopirellula maiorica SM1 GN=RMSM_03614 PE=4 SV=1: VCBS [Tuwongella immobilis]
MSHSSSSRPTPLRLETLESRALLHGSAGAGGLLSVGHFDAFEAKLETEDGAQVLELAIHNHDAETDFTPEGTVFLVKSESQTTRPDGNSFNFLGTPSGAPLWVLPQTFDADLLYLGVASEDIAPGALGSYFESDPRINAAGEYVRFELTGFEGPGQFSLWAIDSFGSPVVAMQTADGVQVNGTPSDTVFSLAGSHDHYNWGFTAPGTYTIRIKATAFLGADGTNPIESEEAVYTFYVQSSPDDIPEVPAPKPVYEPLIVIGADQGGAARVQSLNPETNETLSNFFAYNTSFTGGIRVAKGDIDGDGILDIVTGAGPGGGPHVRVFSGATGAELANFFAYETSYTGGVYVALGDFNKDGRADIITGTGVGGGPRVRIFDAFSGAELANFFAYESTFTGGVFVAAGDINADGHADIITGTGFGGGPRVRVFDGEALADDNELVAVMDFFSADPDFRGGVFVSSGDVNADGLDDVIVGTGLGGGPRVQVFSGANSTEIVNFLAFDADVRGGVRVSATDMNEDGHADLVVTMGPGTSSQIRVFNGEDPSEMLSEFAPFEPAFTGGVFVG